MTDYPRIRSSDLCPLCGRHKDRGLVACWSCYHVRGMRYGDKETESLLEQAEAGLCGTDKLRSEDSTLETL